jgi:hypothetical protein
MLIAAVPQFAGSPRLAVSTVLIRNSTPFPPLFATEFSPDGPEDLVRSGFEREEKDLSQRRRGKRSSQKKANGTKIPRNGAKTERKDAKKKNVE